MYSQSIRLKLIIACLIACFSNINLQAQSKNLVENVHIKTIPFRLKVLNTPIDIELKNDSAVKITASGKTNLFNSPGDNFYKQNAPMLLFSPDSNFVFRAKIEADLKEIYDVAALVLYQDKDHWAKLCFENSIDKEATVVSLVTKRYSDDCNSIKISNNYVYLSIAKKGKEFSFHCSTDNINWYLVRHFRMEFNSNDLMIGFVVHCSRGGNFSAEFSDIKYLSNSLVNMRKSN